MICVILTQNPIMSGAKCYRPRTSTNRPVNNLRQTSRKYTINQVENIILTEQQNESLTYENINLELSLTVCLVT